MRFIIRTPILVSDQTDPGHVNPQEPWQGRLRAARTSAAMRGSRASVTGPTIKLPVLFTAMEVAAVSADESTDIRERGGATVSRPRRHIKPDQ